MTVCDRRCSDLGPGDHCPICLHWSGIHPGLHNPGLSECAICAVQEAAARAMQEPSKEKKKMSIKDTLPEAAQSGSPLHQAVQNIAWALQDDLPDRVDAVDAGHALVHVRAARKALPDQGERDDDFPDQFTDAHLLGFALRNISRVIDGTAYHDGQQLREAEAALRTWLRRKQ